MTLKSKYEVLREGRDFYVSPDMEIAKGSRAKRVVYVKAKRRYAIFKYDDGMKYRKGEDCSEKIASELAKAIGYKAADIDLAVSASGDPGIISYLFVDKTKHEYHFDAEDLFGVGKENENTEYSIKKMHDMITEMFPLVDFNDFLRIILFDALVGERDRHAGNWGITVRTGGSGPISEISPIYDTANCLLLHFQNEEYMDKNTKDDATFRDFINKNHLALYTDNFSGNYTPPLAVVDYLLRGYPDFMYEEARRLKRNLKDGTIERILAKMPEGRMPEKRKEYIIKFVKMQRDDIIKKEEVNGKK